MKKLTILLCVLLLVLVFIPCAVISIPVYAAHYVVEKVGYLLLGSIRKLKRAYILIDKEGE